MKDEFLKALNYRTNEIERINANGLKLLANAIIKQSCIDYVSCPWNYSQRKAIENFFTSEYGKLLLRDTVVPEKVIKHLQEQAELKMMGG